MADNLSTFFNEVSDITVDINDLIEYIEGKKYEYLEEIGHIFEDGAFVGWEYSRDSDLLKRLQNIGCWSVGVSNKKDGEVTPDSQLIGLINNDNYFGTLSIKGLNKEKEWMEFVLKYGF